MVLDTHILEISGNFDAKFLRVGNEVFITEPNDIKTFHIDLAKKEKVFERVEQFKEQNKDEVDGGMVFVLGKMIQVGSHSSSLSIPITTKARKITLQKLKMQFPDYNIKELLSGS